MNNVYWIKGTSTKKYFKEYDKMTKIFDLKIGQTITVYIDPKEGLYQIIFGGKIIFEKNKKSTFRQYIDIWIGMGLICNIKPSKTEFLISFIPGVFDDLIQLLKATSLISLLDKKPDEFRFSLIIDVLYHAKVLNWYDIEQAGVHTSKNSFYEKTLNNSISNIEMELAKDSLFLKRAKEKFYEITK